MNLSVDTLASSSAATNLLEAAVRHEAKEIKDQLGEMNQSIDTLASSSAATNQLSRGMFFFLLQWRCSCFAIPFMEGDTRLFLFKTEAHYSRPKS